MPAGILQSLSSHYTLANCMMHKNHFAPYKSVKLTLLKENKVRTLLVIVRKSPKTTQLLHGGKEECGIFDTQTQWQPHCSPNSHHRTQGHDFHRKQHILAIFYINTTKFLIQNAVSLTAKLPFLYAILNLVQHCYLLVTVFRKYLLCWRKYTSE